MKFAPDRHWVHTFEINCLHCIIKYRITSTSWFRALGAGPDTIEMINPQFDWSSSFSTTSFGSLVQDGKNDVQYWHKWSLPVFFTMIFSVKRDACRIQPHFCRSLRFSVWPSASPSASFVLLFDARGPYHLLEWPLQVVADVELSYRIAAPHRA